MAKYPVKLYFASRAAGVDHWDRSGMAMQDELNDDALDALDRSGDWSSASGAARHAGLRQEESKNAKASAWRCQPLCDTRHYFCVRSRARLCLFLISFGCVFYKRNRQSLCALAST